MTDFLTTLKELMAKATKSPWHYAAYCGVAFPLGKKTEQGDHGLICSTCRNDSEEKTEWPYDPPFRECDNNAQLIAFLRNHASALADVVALLQRWTGDGHLQTFEDRERFRKQAATALARLED